MSSLLDAANVEPNKIEVTNKLPTRVGDVSIMTLEQVFKALEDSDSDNDGNYHYDPKYGYDTSMYYVYGIVGSYGVNSTAENLQDVGLDWYKQLNKPIKTIKTVQTWTNNGKTIFGGPLIIVHYDSIPVYSFNWCCSWGFF